MTDAARIGYFGCGYCITMLDEHGTSSHDPGCPIIKIAALTAEVERLTAAVKGLSESNA